MKEILEDDSFRNRYPIDVTDLYQADPNDAYRTLLCRYADYVGKSIGGEKHQTMNFIFRRYERLSRVQVEVCTGRA